MRKNNAGCQLAARYGAYDDYDDDYYKLRSIHSTTRHYIYCYAYALSNRTTTTTIAKGVSSETKQNKEIEGEVRPLRQTFEFIQFESEAKSSMLYEVRIANGFK